MQLNSMCKQYSEFITHHPKMNDDMAIPSLDHMAWLRHRAVVVRNVRSHRLCSYGCGDVYSNFGS